MMQGQILTVTTQEGHILHGVVCGERAPGATWVIHVHGSYGNFYENFFLTDLVDAITAGGGVVASINTRGHDYYADVKRRHGDGYESRRIGGIREIFSECVLDIEPWVELARAEGAGRIVLQGHSLGAMKVAYHCAQRPQDADMLVLLSPPDNLGLQRADLGDAYDRHLAHALARRVDAPDELMPEDAYFDPISCAAYAAFFEDAVATGMFTYSDRDLMRRSALGDVRIPVLALFGTEGEAVVDEIEYCLDALRAVLDPAQLTTAVVPGANHSYHLHEREVAEHVGAFLRGARAYVGDGVATAK